VELQKKYSSQRPKICLFFCPLHTDKLPAVPTEYQYGQIEETLKQEGKQIQFKLLANNRDRGKSFADRVRYYSVKYISAFANHYGGHVYFGIEDTTAAVLGEVIEGGTEGKIGRCYQVKLIQFFYFVISIHRYDSRFYNFISTLMLYKSLNIAFFSVTVKPVNSNPVK
jgi:hypothetical protein